MARAGKSAIRRDPLSARFAQRLREERRRLGLSQAELAGRAVVNAAYLSRLERAEVCPGVDMLGRLALAMNLDPAALVSQPAAAPPVEVLRDEVRRRVRSLLANGDAAVLQAAAVVLGALDASLMRGRKATGKAE